MKLMMTALTITLFSSLAFGQNQTDDKWPKLCDAQETREAILETAQEQFGKCKLVKDKGISRFGHADKKFQEWSHLILNCAKSGLVQFMAANQVDVKKGTCALTKIRQVTLDGSYCGLTDNVDDSWKYDEKAELYLRDFTEKEVAQLSTIAKQQIILTAKDLVGSHPGLEAPAIWNTLTAIKVLADISEAGDVYYMTFKLKGKTYQEVKYYGGGNPQSMIFTAGTLNIVATNGDDNISCSLKK